MKYGFIGCGNMGGAIAKALRCQTADIMIADPSPNAKAFAESLGVAYTDNESLVSSCDRVFLAVKPHLMKGMLAPLQAILAEKKPLLITMAAGLEIAQRLFPKCCVLWKASVLAKKFLWLFLQNVLNVAGRLSVKVVKRQSVAPIRIVLHLDVRA